MTKKLFVVILFLAAFVFVAGFLKADDAAKPAGATKEAPKAKTTVADVADVVFLEMFPRTAGEEEFYFAMKEDDAMRARAVAKAVTVAGAQAQLQAMQVSGNLIKVKVPEAYRTQTSVLAALIEVVGVNLPEPAAKPAPEALKGLVDALNSKDELVSMNAAIALGRSNDMDAFKALAKFAADSKQGWPHRMALYAMGQFQSRNAVQMQQWREEFLNNVSRIIEKLNDLQRFKNPSLDDPKFKKTVDEARLAIHLLYDYYALFQSNPGAADELTKKMRTLEEVILTANRVYPDEQKVAIKKLFDAAYKGLGDYLDPFSVVWDKVTYKKFTETMTGSFVGIGVYIDKDEEGFVIVSPIFGSPAYAAGLQPRDRILKVNGQDVKNLDADQLREKIQGERGTAVKITIMRQGWDTPRDFDIKRDKITVPIVLSSLLPGDIGYIRLIEFANEAPQQFYNALQELKKNAINAGNPDGIKGLIIDLRNNPGGSVDSTVNIASMFLPERIKGNATLVTEFKGRKDNPGANGQQYARPAQFIPRENDYPIVILVNAASASGAELMTGAMHDHKRAIVMGQKTYGKGCGQNIYPMFTSDGNYWFKVTIFKYYLPNGECIHELGIEPDIVLPLEQLEKWQLDEIEKVMPPKVLKAYIDKYFDKHEALFRTLALSDNLDPSKYPGFEEFYASLKTKLSKDTVRRVLRERVRNEIANRKSKPFVYDLSEDKELQAAIYEVMDKMGKKASDVAEYKGFSDRAKKTVADGIKKAAEETAAAEKAAKEKEAAEKAAAEKNNNTNPIVPPAKTAPTPATP